MTGHVINAAKELVKSDRGQKWRRFEPRDLARILPEIEGEMRRHGYEIPAEIAQELGQLQAT
jgi:hypothetical protein